MSPEEMRDDIPMDVREALAAALDQTAHSLDRMANAARLREALRPKPRTVRLPAAELPAPLEELPKSRGVWCVDFTYQDGLICWPASDRHALQAFANGLAFATSADAEAWLAHLQSWRNPRPGDDWTPHVPGDPMPCDGEARVEYRMREYGGGFNTARVLRWSKADGNHSSASADITAWRYAREES